MNLPTKITFSRLVIVAVMLIALVVFELVFALNSSLDKAMFDLHLGDHTISGVYLVVFVIFVIASFTDFLDGYIARKYNLISDLGKFLDPIADKFLINSMLIFLTIPHAFSPNQTIIIPWIVTVAFILRDLLVDGLRTYASSRQVVIAANIFGKLKTNFQIVAIVFVLLNGFTFFYFDATWPQYLKISDILVYIALSMSIISAIIYYVQNWHILKKGE
jgi:CDP-diacylglycerol--glycerol-3-phosphate 3-phosphatidyltransferase